MKTLEEKLKQAGVELVQPPLEVKWVPSPEEIERCFEFGKKFGEAVKG
jgi:flavorubredoxin